MVLLVYFAFFFAEARCLLKMGLLLAISCSVATKLPLLVSSEENLHYHLDDPETLVPVLLRTPLQELFWLRIASLAC